MEINEKYLINANSLYPGRKVYSIKEGYTEIRTINLNNTYAIKTLNGIYTVDGKFNTKDENPGLFLSNPFIREILPTKWYYQVTPETHNMCKKWLKFKDARQINGFGVNQLLISSHPDGTFRYAQKASHLNNNPNFIGFEEISYEQLLKSVLEPAGLSIEEEEKVSMNFTINNHQYLELFNLACFKYQSLLANKYSKFIIADGLATIEKEDYIEAYAEANPTKKVVLDNIFGKEVCEYKDGDLCLVLISSDLWALRYSNGVKNEFYRDQKTSGETITYVKHRLANIELPI